MVCLAWLRVNINMRSAIGARPLIGIAITLLCLVIIARQINFQEVVDALTQFEWPYLALGIASLAFGYALRIHRWSFMLRASGAEAKWQNCSAPFLGSIALNNVLPLRIGDIIRAFVFPSALGISKTTGTSSLLMERLIDLMTLLLCLAIGIAALPEAQLPAWLTKTAVTLALIGGSILMLGFFFSGGLSRMFDEFARARAHRDNDRLHRLLTSVSGLFRDFEAMSRARILITVIGLSMLVWLGESGLFYFILLGFGFDASPALAVVVMAIATLSTLVPSSPGYVGPFHLAAFTAITLLGGTSAQAGSYAVLAHLALWLPTTVAGAIAIWMNPNLFRAVRVQSRELESNKV